MQPGVVRTRLLSGSCRPPAWTDPRTEHSSFPWHCQMEQNFSWGAVDSVDISSSSVSAPVLFLFLLSTRHFLILLLLLLHRLTCHTYTSMLHTAVYWRSVAICFIQNKNLKKFRFHIFIFGNRQYWGYTERDSDFLRVTVAVPGHLWGASLLYKIKNMQIKH